MNLLADLKMYARFFWGLRGFLRHTITLEEAHAIVNRRMAEREANFLRLVERGIFGYPRSPYRPLLKLAGCELGDIQSMVCGRGLEGTLAALREAGVYATFEEYKGREPMVRGGQTMPVSARDFDNPFLSNYYQAESGGSTGAGTRVSIDLAHLAAQAPLFMLSREAHGLLGAPTAVWYGVLPDNSGLINILTGARFGNVPQKWFSPVVSQEFRPSLKYRLATRATIAMGRLCGVPIPWPEPVRLDEAGVVARWVASTLNSQGICVIRAHVSSALRIALAAREQGLNLTGATFMGGGEPPTPGKVREITGSGAAWVPVFASSEMGRVGQGCAKPADVNDLHFFKDVLALIQYSRQVPGSTITVPAFSFTTLLPTAPKLLLNVESDDYGVIENRSCGCLLGDLGFTDHLRGLSSFSKLTTEGVTLVGSEMVHILEEVLPTRFGGSALDYQLLEEEGDGGFTRLNLLVSPRIEIADETAVVEAIREALRESSVAADLAQALWGQIGTLRVKRKEPITTARGKLIPLRLAQPSEGPEDASIG